MDIPTSETAMVSRFERSFTARAWEFLFAELDSAGIELGSADIDVVEFGITAGFAALVALLADCEASGRIMSALASGTRRPSAP